jgi:hypothetical protein
MPDLAGRLPGEEERFVPREWARLAGPTPSGSSPVGELSSVEKMDLFRRQLSSCAGYSDLAYAYFLVDL